MATTARVKWIEGSRFVGESQSGHAVVMQGLPADGEPSVGIRPMEMLLLGMGGCTAIDVVTILQKAREPVTGVIEYGPTAELGLTANLGEPVPRTSGKAIVTAIDAVADRLAEFMRDGAVMLDGEV